MLGDQKRFLCAPAKIGLIQTLSRLCSLRPDFGRNAAMPQDLIEINGSWKCFFLAWLIAVKNLREWSSVSGEQESAVFFLLFYGLVVGKYPLICAMEIQKIQIVVRIFSGFAPFTELIWVNCGVENLSRLLTAKKMLFSSLFKEFL